MKRFDCAEKFEQQFWGELAFGRWFKTANTSRSRLRRKAAQKLLYVSNNRANFASPSVKDRLGGRWVTYKKQKTSWWLWPEIWNLETAQQIAKRGYWAAVWVALLAAVVATIAVATSPEIGFLDVSAYGDTVIYAVVAWRIKKYSRTFAVVGTFLFLLEKAIFIFVLTVFDWIQIPFVLLFFIQGIRGVFAYHRFLRLSKVTDGGILE